MKHDYRSIRQIIKTANMRMAEIETLFWEDRMPVAELTFRKDALTLQADLESLYKGYRFLMEASYHKTERSCSYLIYAVRATE